MAKVHRKKTKRKLQARGASPMGWKEKQFQGTEKGQFHQVVAEDFAFWGVFALHRPDFIRLE